MEESPEVEVDLGGIKGKYDPTTMFRILEELTKKKKKKKKTNKYKNIFVPKILPWLSQMHLFGCRISPQLQPELLLVVKYLGGNKVSIATKLCLAHT